MAESNPQVHMQKKKSKGNLDILLDKLSNEDDDPTPIKKHESTDRNILFLQREHAQMLEGLHAEIEKLQNYIKDFHFERDVLEVIVPNHDFFRCDIDTLVEKVDDLLAENSDLKRRLQDSNRGLEQLDQKHNLERWQHQQELAEKTKTILCLQKELEVKCNSIAELTSRSPNKMRNSFLRLFSFNSELPSTSTFLNRQSLSNLKCQTVDVEDDCSDVKSHSLPQCESPSHSLNLDYSSYSSMSDKSNSDDEVFRIPMLRKQYTFPSPNYGYRRRWYRPNQGPLKLPPLPNREFVRHQIRIEKAAAKTALDSLAIDHMTLPQVVD